MAKVLTDSQNYTDIANAIRAKAETTATYKPSEMAAAIQNLSGGIPFVVTVITSPYATATATLNSNTVSATADESGTAVLVLEEEGVWTISATDGATSISTEVDTAEGISVELPLAGTLEETSWETISLLSKMGFASQFWSIGDTKTITCNTNSLTVQIIGFDHDDVTDSTSYGRSKAGITFQFVECYPAKYKFNNSAGVVWKNSYARTDRMDYFLTGGGVYEGLGDIQNYIVPVNKLASADTSGSVETVSDSLFLLSEKEIYGSSNYADGAQYDYYAAGNSKVKTLKGSASSWWTRTISGQNYYICAYETGIVTTGSYSSSYGYAPAFCV